MSIERQIKEKAIELKYHIGEETYHKQKKERLGQEINELLNQLPEETRLSIISSLLNFYLN